MRVCSRCAKKTGIGRNRSHAQNRSSRNFRVNIQKVMGEWLCTKCIKRAKKNKAEKVAKAEEKQAEKVKGKVESKKEKK